MGDAEPSVARSPQARFFHTTSDRSFYVMFRHFLSTPQGLRASRRRLPDSDQPGYGGKPPLPKTERGRPATPAESAWVKDQLPKKLETFLRIEFDNFPGLVQENLKKEFGDKESWIKN